MNRFFSTCWTVLKFVVRWKIALNVAIAPLLLEFMTVKPITHLLVYPAVYAVVNLLLWNLARNAMERLREWTRSPRWIPSLVRNLLQAWAFFAIVAFMIFLMFDPSTFALIVLCALIASLLAWLLLTHTGRLALEAARIGVASLPQRWGASSVIVVGIAGVVGVLVAMLAMGAGFEATLKQTGNDSTAIILRGGSQAETNSVITRDQVPLVSALSGIAKGPDGRPAISPELSQVVNMVTRADHTDANAQLRGVGDAAWTLRPQVKIVEGRRFNPGMRELVIGQGARKQYVDQQFNDLKPGSQIELANQIWTVVGIFASGDSHDSELWADAETLASTYRRTAYQSVTVKLDGKDGFKTLKAAMAADPRLKLDVDTTRHYYAKQSEGLSKFLRVLGIVIGSIMAVGAVFGALNTMYAAVAGRAREIATMRAIGFRGLPVVVAVMMETMLLALIGGLVGGAIAWLVFNGYSVSTLGNNFSQVMFQFKVSPELLWNGIKWALGIGLVGGLFPALRAARLPVTEALRAA